MQKLHKLITFLLSFVTLFLSVLGLKAMIIGVDFISANPQLENNSAILAGIMLLMLAFGFGTITWAFAVNVSSEKQ